MAKHLPFSSPQRRSLPTVNSDPAAILQNWKTKLTPAVKRSLPSRTPANFAVTNSRGGLKLTWSPVQTPQDKALGSPDGYEILKSASGTFTSDLVIIPIKGSNVTEYFDSLGGAASTASYRIRTTSGTASNPQSQRGPESGVVSHTSLDSADTTSTATTVRDTFTHDKVRSLARLGNYGAIQPANGIGSTAAATGAVSSAPAQPGGASQSGSAASILFSKLGSGMNTSASMVVALNASITPDVNNPGIISATHLQGTLVSTVTPADGNVLAYSSVDAQYDLPVNIFLNPAGSGNILPASGNITQSLGTQAAPWVVNARSLNAVLFADAFPGVDAGTQLAAAIAALPGSGGVVDCRGLSGILTVSATITVSASNIKIILGNQTWNASVAPVFNLTGNDIQIEGAGEQTIITSSIVGAIGTDKALIGIAGNGCTIRRCQLQGQAVQAVNNSQMGVSITGARTSILENFFSGIDGTHGLNYGVYANAASDVFVYDNRFSNAISKSDGTGAGILVAGGGPGIISRNHIVFPLSSSFGQGAHQIYISQNATNWIISDNVVEGGAAGSIKLFATDAQTPGCRYNTVQNNLILSGANGTNAVGAIVLENNTTFNKIENNVVVTYPNGPGIELVQDVAATSAPDNNNVSNNSLYSIGTYGILIAGGSNTLVSGNHIVNNSTLLAGTYDAIFIEGNVSNSNNTQVLNNYVRNSSGSAGFHAALNISNNAPIATGTLISGNSFDAGSIGTVIDNGSGTILSFNTLAGIPQSASINFGGTSLSHYDESTWTPVATNLTSVNTPTLTGSYTRIGRLVTFTITITPNVTPGSSTASTANSTAITLPFTPARPTSCMATDDHVLNFGTGLCFTDGKCYPPSWSADSHAVFISGAFEV